MAWRTRFLIMHCFGFGALVWTSVAQLAATIGQHALRALPLGGMRRTDE